MAEAEEGEAGEEGLPCRSERLRLASAESASWAFDLAAAEAGDSALAGGLIAELVLALGLVTLALSAEVRPDEDATLVAMRGACEGELTRCCC